MHARAHACACGCGCGITYSCTRGTDRMYIHECAHMCMLYRCESRGLFDVHACMDTFKEIIKNINRPTLSMFNLSFPLVSRVSKHVIEFIAIYREYRPI